MKKRDLLAELRALSVDELKTRERQLAEELMKLRFRKAGGQLEEGHLMRQVRRDRARVLSVLAEKEEQAAVAAA